MKSTPAPLRSCPSRATHSAITAVLLTLATGATAQSFGPFSDSTHEEVRFQKEISTQSAARNSDLRIMGRLVEEALRHHQDPGPDYRMGIPVLVHPQSLMVQSLYLEGFGALFLARVDFPVIAEPHPQRQDSRSPASHSPWETARRRLLGDPSTEGNPSELPQSPSPERLRELHLRLVDTLRQATNMTCLAESDFIAVRVEGRGVPNRALQPDAPNGAMVSVSTGGGVMVTSSDGRTVTRSFSLGGMPPGVDPNTGLPLAFEPPAAADSSSRSTLTLRVRKSDLDALAAGQISLETFASKVESQQYTQ